MTECVTDYKYFCVDNIIPKGTVKCLPVTKMWITSDLKEMLYKKRRAFIKEDMQLLKSIQIKLRERETIRESKGTYRKRREASPSRTKSDRCGQR